MASGRSGGRVPRELEHKVATRVQILRALGRDEAKLAAPDKEAVEKAIVDLKDALSGEDVETITAKTNDLMQAAMKIGETIYKAEQEAAAKADAEKDGAGAKKDEVIDAEFKDVSGDDKGKKSA